ncbi:hypothetical protein EDD11_010557 [Mortierella claussenii]|nr:hypothetical protein EDD11_010557 [Mortierella claussenii]
MIITIAIALNVVKDLVLGNNATPSVVSATPLPEQQQPPAQQQPAATPPPPQEDPNTPYVSLSDCHACPAPCPDQDHLHYPTYLKMDYETPLLHSSKPYTRHVLISTGQDDWDASIDDDKSSLAPFMQKAIDEGQQRLREANNGKDVPRIVLTNSSRKAESWEGPGWQVIVLPDHIVVNNVTQDQCDDFFEAFLKPAVGSVNPHNSQQEVSDLKVIKDQGVNGHGEVHPSSNSNNSNSSSTAREQRKEGSRTITTTTTIATTTQSSSSSSQTQSVSNGHSHHRHHHHAPDQTREVTAGKTTFLAHRWQPKGAIMICSHKKRDKRCGVTAPILKKEFTRILRSKDIYGDAEGDVEIWLISHIGGHKFAGNVIVHRADDGGMAVWYGRVEPCHTQAIVDVTVENGEVIKELHRGSMIGSFDPSRRSKMAW